MPDDLNLPEGMEEYEVLGLKFLAPAGLPPEFITSIAEGMYRNGIVRFDPATETLIPSDVAMDGKVQGMVMKMNGLDVVNSRMLSDDEVKKDLGVKDLFIGKKRR